VIGFKIGCLPIGRLYSPPMFDLPGTVVADFDFRNALLAVTVGNGYN
jgi:hypothetical protein